MESSQHKPRSGRAQNMGRSVGPLATASRPTPSSSQIKAAAAAASLDGFWAAEKKISGRKVRYWKGGGKRAQGWYGIGFTGGWEDLSTPLINQDDLNESEAGIKLLSRVGAPSAPVNNLSVVDETWDFTAEITGRERSRGAIRSMPRELQIERFGEIASWCQNVDKLIDLFEKNEKDVTKWRNALAGLSGAQIALGLVGGGLIIAGIVATGGLAAIPMAAGAIAIAASSAAAGVAVGAARSVAEVGLENAQREGGVQSGRAVTGATESAKGALGIGAKEGLARGLVAGSQAGAASAVGAAAGAGGVAISLYKGGSGAYKAAQIDVGAIWAQVNWNQALQNIVDAEAFLERHSKGFDPGMLAMVKMKLSNTKEKVAQTAQTRWREESRRILKDR